MCVCVLWLYVFYFSAACHVRADINVHWIWSLKLVGILKERDFLKYVLSFNDANFFCLGHTDALYNNIIIKVMHLLQTNPDIHRHKEMDRSTEIKAVVGSVAEQIKQPATEE